MHAKVTCLCLAYLAGFYPKKGICIDFDRFREAADTPTGYVDDVPPLKLGGGTKQLPLHSAVVLTSGGDRVRGQLSAEVHFCSSKAAAMESAGVYLT